MFGSALRKFKTRARVWLQARMLRNHFNADWYLRANPDVGERRGNPLRHYLHHDWLEGRDPTPSFSTQAYLALNPDVAAAGVNPFVHYIKYGIREGRRFAANEPALQERPFVANERAFHSVQDHVFPLGAERAEHVMAIVIPEHNEMSGGIYSFFSIAKTAYNLRFKHDYFVLLMTRPNKMNSTYTRQRNFRNSEDVFRFEQIQRCLAAKTLYIHIPEYAAPNFVDNMDPETLSYLRSRDKIYINILNQKVDIMPGRDDFNDLRSIAEEVTQSVAHHAYFGQKFADRYDLPILLLPAYTDLSGYEPLPFEDKEKLIIYSPDSSPWRYRALKALREGLPDYELREIRGITFDQFMDLATRCRFSITFGEGFDGYLAQPVYQGGIGFAVYNEEFFPSADMLEFDNIFSTGENMVTNVVARIRRFEADPRLYRSTNHSMISVYNQLYSKDDYVRRVLKLIKREFEYYPLHLSEAVGMGRL
jgi:hypothetical protein